MRSHLLFCIGLALWSGALGVRAAGGAEGSGLPLGLGIHSKIAGPLRDGLRILRLADGARVGARNYQESALLASRGNLRVDGPLSVAAGETLTIICRGQVEMVDGSSLGGPGVIRILSDPDMLDEHSTGKIAADLQLEGAVVAYATAERKLYLTLSTAADVNLEIYDLQGRRVSGLHQEHVAAGTRTLPTPSRVLSPSIYFYQLEINGKRRSGKVVMLR